MNKLDDSSTADMFASLEEMIMEAMENPPKGDLLDEQIEHAAEILGPLLWRSGA